MLLKVSSQSRPAPDLPNLLELLNSSGYRINLRMKTPYKPRNPVSANQSIRNPFQWGKDWGGGRSLGLVVLGRGATFIS